MVRMVWVSGSTSQTPDQHNQTCDKQRVHLAVTWTLLAPRNRIDRHWRKGLHDWTFESPHTNHRATGIALIARINPSPRKGAWLRRLAAVVADARIAAVVPIWRPVWLMRVKRPFRGLLVGDVRAVPIVQRPPMHYENNEKHEKTEFREYIR